MSNQKTKIGLLVIATNKYIHFLNNLLYTADLYFCKDSDVTFFIFTNKKIEINNNISHKIINVEHKPWPWMTLGRYKIFTDAADQLSSMDYLFYCDADMKFVSKVGLEILGDRVATQHPGYVNTRGTPETNPKSLAYIRNDEHMIYFAGGFNGGTATEFLKMSKTLSNNIEIDFNNNIIAIWHDESHINRYFIDNPPTKILDFSYCYPESWLNLYPQHTQKIIALNKDHASIRS